MASANQRTVFVNGEYCGEQDARISIFDRGFLMADAVYEVSAVIHGKMLDNEAHLNRLERSLTALNIPMPISKAEIITIQEALIEKNQLQEGIVYLQITRGYAAERSFTYDPQMSPTLVMFTQNMNLLDDSVVAKGLKIITCEDIRWHRRDIKTTQLLAQSMAKMQAKNAGYDDAWMIDRDGFITEGTSNNAWLIKNGCAVTHPAGYEILNGITRQALIRILQQLGITVEERAFSLEEALSADEAFITSAGAMVMPVLSINDQAIGDGKVGDITLKLRKQYLQYVAGIHQ